MAEEGRPTGQKLIEEEKLCNERAAIAAKYTKQEILEQKARIREKPPVTTAPAPPDMPEIAQSREAPLGASRVFISTGRWRGESEGVWYYLYAGASREPETDNFLHSQVKLYREREPVESNEPLPFVGTYDAPGDGTEPLKLTGEDGDVLSLETAGGQKYSFNVSKRAFVGG